MKIYLASRGEYDDREILAAFTTREMAAEAGSNEPLELEVKEELPPKVTVREMSWSSSLMHQIGVGHFHSPNPDPIDCPYTNVLRVPNESDETRDLWPWDIEEGDPIPSCEVTSGGGQDGRWVNATGVDREQVGRQFERAVIEAKVKLIRKEA